MGSIGGGSLLVEQELRASTPRQDVPAVTDDIDSERLAQIVEFATDAIISKDRHGLITSWNRGAETLYGYGAAEVLRHPISVIIPPELTGEEWELLQRVLDGEHIEHYRTRRRRRDGVIVEVSLTLFALRGWDGAIIGAASIGHDISRRVAAEGERRRIEKALRRTESFLEGVSSSMEEGLLLLDGDGRIATVNSAAKRALGFDSGELVGKAVCDALGCRREGAGQRCPPECCELGAIAATPTPLEIAEQILIRRDGSPLPVSLCAAPLEEDRATPAAHIVVFHDAGASEDERDRERRELEEMSWIGRVRDAMSEHRLLLAGQPIVSLSSGVVSGRELLVRLRDRAGELVTPGTFLPAAERYGLIAEIDRWVIAQAAQMAGRGQAVNVNLSARSLGDPQLAGYVERALHEQEAQPGLVTFEITETALTRQLALAGTLTTRLAALGCEFALDDFGTGYGAFTYLKTLPIRYLKIDIEFVRDLLTNGASDHLVSATVQLAKGFGQLTVAEGVEDEQTLQRLRELGVDFVQGYLLGRPELINLD